MLQDYTIIKTTKRTGKWISVIEFILILFMIQSAVLLLNGREEPDHAIRVRILAHSNATGDQQVKELIRQEIEPLINQAFAESSSQSAFIGKMEELDQQIIRIAEENAQGHAIKFEKKAALFPPKRSGFYITPQAPYEAFVLTIGSGRGDNWWCSLFPNVCFPDEQATDSKREEEKVTFFLWEWIKGLFS